MDGIGIDDKGWYGIGQLDDMDLLCDDLEQVSWESWYMGLILFQGKEPTGGDKIQGVTNLTIFCCSVEKN